MSSPLAKSKMLSYLLFLGFLSLGMDTQAVKQPGPSKIRTAVTAIAGSMTVTWAANEAKIFAKHGFFGRGGRHTPSELQGMNTLIAREVDFVHVAGGTTAAAVVGAADAKNYRH